MKRGKEDSRYHPRKFVLCEAEDTLKYHVKENKVYELFIVNVCLIFGMYQLYYITLYCISRNPKLSLEYLN